MNPDLFDSPFADYDPDDRDLLEMMDYEDDRDVPGDHFDGDM